MNYYFVTGTSSGIGKSLIEELLKDDNNMVFGFARRNFTDNPHFNYTKLDLSKLEDVKKYSFPELKNTDKLVLINNAGTLGEIKHFGDLYSETIITSFNVNITSVALLTNNFIKTYQRSKSEKIVINISSGAASSAYDGWASYCATKSAINMLTLAIEKEQSLKENPVKVFAIAPGVVDTFMQDSIRQTDVKNFSNIKKFHILKNEGSLYKSKDVAKKLIDYCNDTKRIQSTISRIEF